MTSQSMPRISVTGMLIIAATMVSGLFSFGLDRALVAADAWRHIGVLAWADYSRHPDLENGLVVYPIGAILCWALVFVAALAYRLDRSAPRQVGLPIRNLHSLGRLRARHLLRADIRLPRVGAGHLFPASANAAAAAYPPGSCDGHGG